MLEDFNFYLNKLIKTTIYGGKDKGYSRWGDSDWHLMTLFSLVLQIKAKNILELGVREGTTSLPLALAAYHIDGIVEAIDKEECEWKCPEFLLPHYKFIQSDAISYLESQVNNNKNYDLIYVDDWHSYEHVKKELELIDKITSNKSVILLHDLMGKYSEPNYFDSSGEEWNGGQWEGGGPYRAVKELDSGWEWMTIPVNNGLTLLRKRA